MRHPALPWIAVGVLFLILVMVIVREQERIRWCEHRHAQYVYAGYKSAICAKPNDVIVKEF